MRRSYASGVLSGQGMLVGAFFGVAAFDGAQGTLVECETRGEFELAKDPTQPMTAGARIFWNDTDRRRPPPSQEVSVSCIRNSSVGGSLSSELAWFLATAFWFR